MIDRPERRQAQYSLWQTLERKGYGSISLSPVSVWHCAVLGTAHRISNKYEIGFLHDFAKKARKHP